MPILDRVNQDLVDEVAAAGGAPIYTLTPNEARSVLLRAQSSSVFKPDAQVKDWNVDSGLRTLRLRTIHPHPAADRRPIIVYFHGGGWVLGDSTTHDRIVRELGITSLKLPQINLGVGLIRAGRRMER